MWFGHALCFVCSTGELGASFGRPLALLVITAIFALCGGADGSSLGS